MMLNDEINRTSPAWSAAFARAKAANPVVPFVSDAPMEEVTGWYRWRRKASWHKWATWFKNEFFLAPICATQLTLDRRYANRLRPREDIPANGKICKGCAAQDV